MRKLLNFINHPKMKLVFILTLLFSCYVMIAAHSYVNAVSKDLANSVFRLHVVANSDTKEDQNLKYVVRDHIISYMKSLTTNTTTKEEAIKIAKEHRYEFEEIAKQTIQEQGFDYDVTIHFGNFFFPTKTYGDISLPAGDYDALRIEIGKAKGQNWWCVMFPPLCFVDVSSGIVPEESKEVMKENLSEEEYKLISEGNTQQQSDSDIKLKFKLIEFLQNTKLFTAKN